VVEDVPLNLGRVRAPGPTAISSSIFQIQTDGFLLGPPVGAPNGSFIDGQQRGQFTLIGLPGGTISFSATPELVPVPGGGPNTETCSDTGSGTIGNGNVELTGVNVVATTSLLDSNGKGTAFVGATFSVDKLASGPGVCHYTLTFSAS